MPSKKRRKKSGDDADDIIRDIFSGRSGARIAAMAKRAVDNANKGSSSTSGAFDYKSSAVGTLDENLTQSLYCFSDHEKTGSSKDNGSVWCSKCKKYTNSAADATYKALKNLGPMPCGVCSEDMNPGTLYYTWQSKNYMHADPNLCGITLAKDDDSPCVECNANNTARRFYDNNDVVCDECFGIKRVSLMGLARELIISPDSAKKTTYSSPAKKAHKAMNAGKV